jgi:hypothetical protein
MQGRGSHGTCLHAACRRRADAPSQIAAVEVDAPGCSYNPDAAQHEEAVARAVGEENRKLIDAELRSKPPPKRVDWQPETDPLLALQVCHVLQASLLPALAQLGPLFLRRRFAHRAPLMWLLLATCPDVSACMLDRTSGRRHQALGRQASTCSGTAQRG